MKTRVILQWAFTFAAIFVMGFSVGNIVDSMQDEEKVEIFQDVDYESLLGIIENIPHVDYWTIEREKYLRDNYDNIGWDLKIKYDDGTSVSFDGRSSMSQLFEDLENLNEAKLYTSSKME